MKPPQEAKLLREIREARTLFDRFGHTLSHRADMARLLSLYREAIEETQNLMHQLGVAASCTACAGEEPGGCCFEGIEAGYDRILLLINLLMGCNIPDSREIAGNCLFVGMKGCNLQARYYYCVHYFCPALQTTLGPDAKHELQVVVGKELAAGWELERALREYLIQLERTLAV